MNVLRRAVVASVVTLCAGSCFALGGGVYSDSVLIRVMPDSVRERLAVAQIPMTFMGESERVDGQNEYLADPSDLAALLEAGIEYSVIRDDVQAMVDAERARLDGRLRWGAGPQLRGADVFFDEFRDLAEITAFLDGLLASYPGLISKETIGQSVQGRDIEGYTISGAGTADSKPSLIFNSGAHAREWIAPMTVLYMMRQLVEDYGSDAEVAALLDSVSFRIAPMMNPDGYLYTWNSERFWRKTRRNNGNGTFGVDWNRNFSTGWGGPGASGDSSSDIYRGVSAFSEPEARALRDYTLSIPNAAFHIDFHAFSQLVLYPWGYIESALPEPDLSIHRSLAEAYAGTIASVSGVSYIPIPGNDLYIASGIATDWHYDQGGVYSFTLELRPSSSNGTFAPPPSEILPCAQENYEAVLGLAASVASGITSSYPSGLPGQVQPDAASPVSVEIIPVFSGPLNASTAAVYSRVGSTGAFVASAMSASGDVYSGALPAAPCGEVIEYYFAIESDSGIEYTVPSGAPGTVLTVDVVGQMVVFEDTIETDLGWTSGVPSDDATTGQWERGDPQGTAAQPENDHTMGGTQCWITGLQAGAGLGSFDVDGGTTTLVSPVFDASESGEFESYISFWVWYSNDTGGNANEDTMPVDISNDGGATWIALDVIGASTDGWEERRYRVSDIVTPTDSIRLRFRASDLGGGSLVEAGVDDLSVEAVGCDGGPGNPADLAEPFGVLDLADISAFIAGFTAQDPIADLAAPFGVFDLADVTLFTSSFIGGAP